MLVLLSEYATASCAKSSPPFAFSYTSRALLARLDLLGRGRDRHRDQDVRDVVLGIRSGAFCWRAMNCSSSRGEDVDAADDVALTQQLQRHLAADLVAEIAIVDALLRERPRQVGEGDLVALGDVVERAVEHLFGHFDADAVGALSWISSTISRSRICLRSTVRGGSSVFC